MDKVQSFWYSARLQSTDSHQWRGLCVIKDSLVSSGTEKAASYKERGLYYTYLQPRFSPELALLHCEEPPVIQQLGPRRHEGQIWASLGSASSGWSPQCTPAHSGYGWSPPSLQWGRGMLLRSFGCIERFIQCDSNTEWLSLSSGEHITKTNPNFLWRQGKTL